ncbi:MAG: hypothetical protein RXQ93_05765 [Caldisphaera sp.]
MVEGLTAVYLKWSRWVISPTSYEEMKMKVLNREPMICLKGPLTLQDKEEVRNITSFSQ